MVQEEWASGLGRHASQRACKTGALTMLPGRRPRGRLGIDGHRLLSPSAAQGGSPLHQVDAPRDPAHPGPNRQPRLIRGARAMQAQEGLLDEVLSPGGVAAGPPQVGPQLRRERGIQRVKRLDAPGLIRHHLRLEIGLPLGLGAHPEGF